MLLLCLTYFTCVRSWNYSNNSLCSSVFIQKAVEHASRRCTLKHLPKD